MGSLFALFLIPEGLAMLGGAYCLYNSRYITGGLLILAPSLYIGYISWVEVFQYLLHVPAEISWGLAFAIPISTSAMAFLMRIRDWHDRARRTNSEGMSARLLNHQTYNIESALACSRVQTQNVKQT
jgi:hypothetical protein